MNRQTTKYFRALLLLAFFPGCYTTWNCTTTSPSLSNIKRWHDYLQVTDAPDNAPIATTQTHLSNVSEKTAYAKMCQSLESYNGKLGYRLSTALHIASKDKSEGEQELPAITAVVVKDHLYYIALLDFPSGSSNRAAYEEAGGIIPAIAVVDGEDQTKPGWVRTEDDKGNPYKIMLYTGTQAVLDDNNIYRHLRNSGYSTATGCHTIDSPTLEVNDEWRPYFTATYNVIDNCRSGSIGQANYPSKLLVADAQTKEVKAYDLDDPNTKDKDERAKDIPAWIDQIYSKRIVKEWVTNWGNNPDNYGKTSEINTFRIDEGLIDEVMNAENDNIVFVTYLTSMLPDNSLVGVMLVSPQTGKATFYKTQGRNRAMAAKSVAVNVIKQATLRWGFDVEDLTLHTIYGVPTWQGELTLPSFGDNGQQGSLYAGTVLLKADDNMMPANVVWSHSKHETFTNYEHLLYVHPTMRIGSNVMVERELPKGIVDTLQTVVVGGNTTYLIRLKEKPEDVFEVAIQYIGDPNTEEAMQVKPGDSIYLKYADLENRKLYTVREIHRNAPATGK